MTGSFDGFLVCARIFPPPNDGAEVRWPWGNYRVVWYIPSCWSWGWSHHHSWDHPTKNGAKNNMKTAYHNHRVRIWYNALICIYTLYSRFFIVDCGKTNIQVDCSMWQSAIIDDESTNLFIAAYWLLVLYSYPWCQVGPPVKCWSWCLSVVRFPHETRFQENPWTGEFCGCPYHRLSGPRISYTGSNPLLENGWDTIDGDMMESRTHRNDSFTTIGRQSQAKWARDDWPKIGV